jgi:hypothetical protein
MTETFLLNINYKQDISLQYGGSKTANINLKKLQSTFKRSCYRPCSHRSKTAKIKRERERGEKGIAEIIHLMKPITRSPVSGQTAAI